MRDALDLISRLHGRRADGSCTCDIAGRIANDACPTSIAIRRVWFPEGSGQ